MKHRMVTKLDSTRYLLTIMELHEKDPENKTYFGMLMKHLGSSGHYMEIGRLAHDEVEKDPHNKLAWALLGETEMRAKKWDEAIRAYQHAADIDSTYTEVHYNIGICYSYKAVALKDSLQKSHKKLTADDSKRIIAVFNSAKEHLEKASRLDPKQEDVEWAEPLYQIYNVLNEQEKAESTKKKIKKTTTD